MLKHCSFFSTEQKPAGKIIKFGTNIDLSDPKRWAETLWLTLPLVVIVNATTDTAL